MGIICGIRDLGLNTDGPHAGRMSSSQGLLACISRAGHVDPQNLLFVRERICEVPEAAPMYFWDRPEKISFLNTYA